MDENKSELAAEGPPPIDPPADDSLPNRSLPNNSRPVDRPSDRPPDELPAEAFKSSGPAPPSARPTSASTGRRVVVCERSGAWAVALRRELGEAMTETRSLAECAAALKESAGAMAVVEIRRDNCDDLLALLQRAGRRDRRTIVVVGARRWQNWRWLLREAGAVHVVFSPRQLRPLRDMVDRCAEGSARPSRSLRETVWAELPWPRHG